MSDFSSDQKRYLEGFTSGVLQARVRNAATMMPRSVAPKAVQTLMPSGPDALHFLAQDALLSRGGQLNDQEKWKRAEHPFDAYARFKAQALQGNYPKPEDNFRWRYHGLFYVAPAQNSYMCRLRIPNGILSSAAFARVADLADECGGGYAHVTTRANLQIRDIAAEYAPLLIEELSLLGLNPKGSGADNIRNVTGTPTAGIDPQELLDTRPYAKAMHHHILNDRSLYGLPRKFNIAFDGAGSIAALEETNDIGFQAVEIAPDVDLPQGFGAQICFRLALGGITGHKDFARDTGVILPLGDAIGIADAILRVFIAEGDRSNRAKARLKYVLDRMGFDAFLEKVEAQWGKKLTRFAAAQILPRQAPNRLAHIGVHPQKQVGLQWLGVALEVGRLSTEQMRGLAQIAQKFGDGDIRLTVWQNLLISGVCDENIAAAEVAIEAQGLTLRPSILRQGLIACTGATGCKFAAAHTKEDALNIAAQLETKIALDSPVNIHLTGCHHSCAQHYIGDIGLIAQKITLNEEGDQAMGYSILAGGGTGSDAQIAEPIWDNILATDAPLYLGKLLSAYLAHRLNQGESFFQFTQRLGAAQLKLYADEVQS